MIIKEILFLSILIIVLLPIIVSEKSEKNMFLINWDG